MGTAASACTIFIYTGGTRRPNEHWGETSCGLQSQGRVHHSASCLRSLCTEYHTCYGLEGHDSGSALEGGSSQSPAQTDALRAEWQTLSGKEDLGTEQAPRGVSTSEPPRAPGTSQTYKGEWEILSVNSP